MYSSTVNMNRARLPRYQMRYVTFLLFVTIFIGKLQNVNIILLGAFPEATDAFSDAFIVCYSSKRCMYNRHFLIIA